jgi:prophage regulatory protein
MAKINSPLSEIGFLRLSQIVGNPKAKPPINPIYPVSKSTWWAGVKSGRFPKPVKLGPRITAWRTEDILELIRQTGNVREGGSYDL